MVETKLDKKRKRVEKRRLKVYYHLVKNPCVDCGETNVVVLEFDHVRGKKFKGVSYLLDQDYSWGKIQDEIDKCDVRCANCHRLRTAHKNGYWKVCLD